MSLISIHQCRRFAAQATELGATIPADLSRLLTAADAVHQWTPADNPQDIGNAIASGEFTADSAAKFLEVEYKRPANNRDDIRVNTEIAIARTFRTVLAKTGGDAVIESLRPKFDNAKASMVEASKWITPSTTAEQVLEAGPEAAAAWSALDEHRRTLDAIYALLAEFNFSFQVIGPQPFMQTGGEVQAAFVVAPGANLTDACIALEPLRQSGRGGRWMKLMTVAELRLNTLNEARKFIDDAQAAYLKGLQDRRNTNAPLKEI